MLPLSPIHNFELSLLIKVPNVRHFFSLFQWGIRSKEENNFGQFIDPQRRSTPLHVVFSATNPICLAQH